jgi:hypothetical protein
MRRKFALFLFIPIFIFIFTGCGIMAGDDRNEDAMATAISQTLAAMNTQNPPTQMPAQPTNTPLPLPTITLQPTGTSVAGPTATLRPCNMATFISENPQDGITFQPGESFTKSWRLKNTGTCTWNSNYKVVYYSGDNIDGAGTSKLANSTAPGEVMDITYNFKAPNTPGSYQTLFKLQDDNGVNFAQFWVQFKVGSPTFAVTNVVLSAEHSTITGACPQTFDYQADIKANGAGSVTYYLAFSDGSNSSTQTLTFNGAGTKTITGSWELNASGNYWIKLYVDQPNHQWFGPLNLSLTCTP